MKVPSIKHRAFVDYYFLAKRNVARAAEIAGITERAAQLIVARPEIKALIEERQAELSAVAMASVSEVVGVLLRQMRGDIADLFPDEPLLQEARKNGVSRLVKKIEIKEYTDKDGNTTRNVKLELYSAQEAAKSLARIFGLDSHAELERGRMAIKMYCELKDCTPEVAIIALAPHVPAVIKVKDEFLRRPQLAPGE